MEHFDLETLSQRTGISPVKLEHCISEGYGTRDWLTSEYMDAHPGMLDQIAGVHVTLASLMLDIGSSTDAIRWMMRAITGYYTPGRNPLGLPTIAAAINGKSTAFVQVADSSHVRWKIGTNDTGWFRFAPDKSADPDHEPSIVVALNVARVRDLVRGESSSTR